MEVEIQRTDSQRSQQNGPRVSFNRDVHVKRIGTRPNESTNYPIQTKNLQPPETSHLRREPPTNLDEESILKEAALVLKQAESVKCKAEPSELTKTKTHHHHHSHHKGTLRNKPTVIPNKFNSLPTRKKNKPTKPLSRSVSDASAKKTKKPSIFNLFSRRSDSNLSHIEEDARFKESGGRRLVQRSKSDLIDSTYNKDRQQLSKSILTKKRENDNNEFITNNANNIGNNNGNSSSLLIKPIVIPQLSPIIENTQKESYFEEVLNNEENLKNNELENNRKVTVKRKENTDLERNSQNRLSDKENSPPSGHILSDINNKLNTNQQHEITTDFHRKENTEENKLEKPAAVNLPILSTNSYKDMHSSQLPPEKPPLTKGRTVDGMVKRLSMERFSPPPTISGPAFSYTRPNEPIIYAQLAADQTDDNHHLHHRKVTMRSPTREMDSPPYRTFQLTNGFSTKGTAQHERTPNYYPSHNNNNNHKNINNNKSEVYLNGSGGGGGGVNYHHYNHEPRSLHHHTTTTNIRGGLTSPTEWKQLSPRNLSDDEGLGFEPRKYFEDELPSQRYFADNQFSNRHHHFERSKSPSVEPPIIPVIRSSSPPTTIESTVLNRGRADGMDARRKDYVLESRNEFNNLSNRREALESKIHSRKFNVANEWKPLTTIERSYSPDRNFVRTSYEIERPPVERIERVERTERSNRIHERTTADRPDRTRYLSPERDNIRENKFHIRESKLPVNEIDNKYSPDRSHIDIPSSTPAAKESALKSSKYIHTRYYHDDKGRVKEIHEKETTYDEEGKPHVKEFVRRERLDSPDRSKDPLLSVADRYRMDCEPRSLDSQISDINRTSPDNIHIKQIDPLDRQGVTVNRSTNLSGGPHEEKWHISTLTRDKRQQRSFDKGDSGIENDFRKESFNGDITTKWRKPITTIDIMKACELFLKKERRHTEEMNPKRKKYDFVFRERSIDDGSHFDPRLDKYPKESQLRRKDTFSSDIRSSQHQLHPHQSHHHHDSSVSPPKGNIRGSTKDLNDPSVGSHPGGGQHHLSETMKREKKIGGFERVKKLFGGNKNKKENKEYSPNGEKSPSTEKDRYMVNEDEMRQRYLEYRGPETKEMKSNDISTRRRLSTPRASPLLKRTPSDKEIRPSPLSQKNETDIKPEKTSWFKSLDRKSKKKNEKSQLGSSSFRTTTEDDFSTLNRTNKKPSYRSPPPPVSATTTIQTPAPTSGKNFRFFGDTDLDSNPPTISKAATTSRTRPTVGSSATLNRTQKYSQSAYNLDRIPNRSAASRARSTSMQNLEDGVDEIDNTRKTRHHSRSRTNLKNISESGSETEERDTRVHHHHTSTPKVPPRDKKPDRYRFNDNSSSPYRSSNDRDSKSPYREVSSDPARIEFRKPPPGPPKPARSMERSRQSSSYSRERDRLHDSSGTEGDSSLHSQRSVVYLHATTVGDIPQPYKVSPSKRRTQSREDLRSKRSVSTHNSQNTASTVTAEPMTRSVSRSVSMLAPWTPKHRSEGYEINYAQDKPTAPVVTRGKQISTMPRKNSGSNSSLNRSKNSHSKSRKYTSSKEDLSSARNSSIGSASKSGISGTGTRTHMYEKRGSETRSNSIGRRRIK